MGGNIDAERDWGHARDYVEMMWLMLQQPNPDDYVVATGEKHSVREFIEKAFAVDPVNLKITWEGKGINEIGKDQNGVVRVRIDERYFRPTEVELLIGDPTKARKVLNWVPRTKFQDLVEEMVLSDISELEKLPAQ